MDKLAFGFWGCYFGTTALMMTGTALAYVRSFHRILANGLLAAGLSALFVLAVLGALPFSDDTAQTRFLAHVAMLASTVLAYLLFSVAGALSSRTTRRRTRWVLAGLAVAAMGVGWLLPAAQALAVGLGLACLLGLMAWAVALRNAYRGDRLAWLVVAGVFFMLIALCGLSWIALARGQVPWQAHAVSAVAGAAYLAAMATTMWARYAYLIELNRVMAHGPSYDPVTRMRSHSETGQMMGDAFKHHRGQPATLGVLVVNIGNLYALDKLHGTAALNHALFVCAGRLRRVVPAHLEMGRLSADGFLLLARNCSDSGELIGLAHRIAARLSRLVLLHTSLDAAQRESTQTRWKAEVGIGVLLVSDPAARASGALATGRAMSRTAMSYASRVAWFDQASGEAVELSERGPDTR